MRVGVLRAQGAGACGGVLAPAAGAQAAVRRRAVWRRMQQFGAIQTKVVAPSLASGGSGGGGGTRARCVAVRSRCAYVRVCAVPSAEKNVGWVAGAAGRVRMALWRRERALSANIDLAIFTIFPFLFAALARVWACRVRMAQARALMWPLLLPAARAGARSRAPGLAAQNRPKSDLDTAVF